MAPPSPPAAAAAKTSPLLPLPSCMAIFDRFWYCANPGSQFQHYYRHGQIESCAEFFSDWGTCLKSQLVADEARKREIMANTHIMQPKTGQNTVLQPKVPPSWEGQ